MDTWKSEWFGNIKGDILAGLVVALALIPEAVAFSLTAGKSVGGRLLEAQGSPVPWIIYGAAGFTLFVVVLLLKKWGPLQQSLTDAATKDNKPKEAPHVITEPPQNRTFPTNNWVPEALLRKNTRTE